MTEFYNPAWSKDRRRELRKRMPLAEAILWKHLRNRGVAGLKFRQQFGVGPYIADFVCSEHHIAIELDGDSHVGKDVEEYDVQRDAYFQGVRLRVVRISNDRIFHDLEAVLGEIASMVSGSSSSPPFKGGV